MEVVITIDIKIRDVCFRYANADRLAIKNLTLDITSGRSFCVMGPSGSGKTTLTYLILGLLQPTTGQIYVNDQLSSLSEASVGYVPQSINLLNGTIIENVAFSIPPEQVDQSKVRFALELAQLDGDVGKLRFGENTVVGEDGRYLSGGQRQRLAIARAIYFSPKLLILDEATSALDRKTEDDFLSVLSNITAEITCVAVAHSHRVADSCDCTFLIRDGQLAQES